MGSNRLENLATLKVYKTLTKYNVGLAYSGAFTDDLTESFILFCEDIIVNQENDLKTARTVNFILCETFQNVVRHSQSDDDKDINDFTGYFGFHKKHHDYRINSINFIQEIDKEKAVNLIENVNNKSSKELRSLYRERLNDGVLSEKGGAGLGFIQIARKSGKNILYNITPTENGTDQLHQQIMISEKDEEKHSSRIDMSHEQFKEMTNMQQILQFKGDFSEIKLESIARIVKSNLKFSERIEMKKKKVELCFEKLFDNVKKHGARINGLNMGSLVVTIHNDQFIIEMGNLIQNDEVESVKSKLDIAKGNSRNLREKSSIQKMISEDVHFTYSFHPYDESHAFLNVSSIVKR